MASALAREFAAAVRQPQVGTLVYLRQDHDRPPSPPNFYPGLALTAALAIGNTAMAIQAGSAGDGRFVPGDTLVLPGQTVVVTNTIAADNTGTWTGITFIPAINAVVAQGTAVTVARYANETPVHVKLSYYAAQVIEGILQVQRDLRLIVPAWRGSAGGAPPAIGDQIRIGSDIRNVLSSDPNYVGSEIINYTVRAR